ncbi:MAG: VanW family protein [Actinomycetota bacterium]
MRNALLAVAAVLVVFLAGWIVDDKLLGGDISRNTSVAGVDVGRLDVGEAEERLTDGRLTDRRIELVSGGNSLTASAGELGVMVETADALEAASDRSMIVVQPFAWVGSFFSGDDIDATYDLDVDQLAEFFAGGGEAVFDLDFGRPVIEVVDGQFVEMDTAAIPVVDLDELRVLVLEAAQDTSGGVARIEIPIGGQEQVDRGADDLIAEANELVGDGVFVRVTGERKRILIPAETLRNWIVFGGTVDDPTITFNQTLAQATVETLFIDIGEDGTEPTFTVDGSGTVRIIGNSAGSECCQLDSHERIWAAMQRGETEVELSPREDSDVRGIEWAESLGIQEVVGEFTTNYAPGQSRVTNIQRISELTRGAIIEPGGEFSINDFVGVRTRDKGFVSAGVIVNGVFNNSVGGGISQYATTLFNAAFFAGLDFGEYQSHSIYISRYPYGREATVSHPHPDLEIINNTPYGILIWPTTTDTSITVQLFSTKWVEGEQTGQTEGRQGSSCTRVTTERTRTWVDDGRTEVDSVIAVYRPEGVRCDGSPSDPADRTTTTTSTVPPSTTVP